MEIQQIRDNKKRFLDLLLLADEQETMIDRYLQRGDMYVLFCGSAAVAVSVVTDEGSGVCELKNLAVRADRQRQGLGRQMVLHLWRTYAGMYHTMRVGTGDSVLTLPFYKRLGFEEAGRIENFFVRHYDHPIYECGRRLTDMVVLQRRLPAEPLSAEGLRKRLAERIHAADIRELCAEMQWDEEAMRLMYGLMWDAEPRVANNAAWVLTHVDATGRRWLEAHKEGLIDEAMSPTRRVKLGLLLMLIAAMPLAGVERADFLDFCLAHMMRHSAPGSQRALCIKLAYALCKGYGELLEELRDTLCLMEEPLLTPAVRSARKNVLATIGRTLRTRRGIG